MMVIVHMGPVIRDICILNLLVSNFHSWDESRRTKSSLERPIWLSFKGAIKYTLIFRSRQLRHPDRDFLWYRRIGISDMSVCGILHKFGRVERSK